MDVIGVLGGAVPLFMVHGVLLNFLYAGQHELSHWTVFRTRALNEWGGRVFGFILFYPRTFDQVQHMAHHRFTQNWTEDGELARSRYTRRSYLLWMTGLSYWYSRWLRIARFSMGARHRAVFACQAACGNHSRSALARRRIRRDWRRVGGRAQCRGGGAVAGAHDRHEIRASIAEHHRALRAVARSECSAQHPQHAYQRGHALARLADAVPHGAPRLPRCAVSSAARIK